MLSDGDGQSGNSGRRKKLREKPTTTVTRIATAMPVKNRRSDSGNPARAAMLPSLGGRLRLRGRNLHHPHWGYTPDTGGCTSDTGRVDTGRVLHTIPTSVASRTAAT